MSLVLNPLVGVAPGTATMQISGGGGNLGCPSCYSPGYYSSAPPPAATPATIGPRPRIVELQPYGTQSTLKGLGAATIRWDLLVFTVGLGFAATLGYFAYGARKKPAAQ